MSIETGSPLDLLPLEEALPAHLHMSDLNGEFLEFVAQNPEMLERDTFRWLHDQHWLRKLNLQSWPLFMDESRRREVEAMTLGIDKLMKGVVQRFLDAGPAHVMEFYRHSVIKEKNLKIIMAEPNGISTSPSRADYVEDADGFKCLEYNAGGALGGYQTGIIGGMHLASEPISRFLEATGRRVRAAETLEAYFRHLIDDATRLGIWKEGEFNVAAVNRPNTEENVDLHSEGMYDRALQRVLKERGMTGRAFACESADFGEERQLLVARGWPVHVVLQLHTEGAHLHFPFMMSKMGCVSFLSGPVGDLLSDKRVTAYVSEHAGSDEFTAAERALIERYIPWTRALAPGRATTFRGRPLRLPDDLADLREEMVLKKATGRSGEGVYVGRFMTDADWRQAVAAAAASQDAAWIVQECVHPVPYCFQRGERGAMLHDLVWGLFAFGDYFGGAFLRMQPRASGSGVVNSAQGAEEGVCLFVEED